MYGHIYGHIYGLYMYISMGIYMGYVYINMGTAWLRGVECRVLDRDGVRGGVVKMQVNIEL